MMLRGRPEEQFRFAIGLVVGAALAIPMNVLNLTNWRYPPELGYVFALIVICTAVFRNRSFVVGAGSVITLVSLPQAIASLFPTPGPEWQIYTGAVWLLVLAILGTLYLLRRAETSANADLDLYWLFRPRN